MKISLCMKSHSSFRVSPTPSLSGIRYRTALPRWPGLLCKTVAQPRLFSTLDVTHASFLVSFKSLAPSTWTMSLFNLISQVLCSPRPDWSIYNPYKETLSTFLHYPVYTWKDTNICLRNVMHNPERETCNYSFKCTGTRKLQIHWTIFCIEENCIIRNVTCYWINFFNNINVIPIICDVLLRSRRNDKLPLTLRRYSCTNVQLSFFQ